MRKRNISFIVDKLLWFIILILPLLFALVFTCSSMNNYQLEVSASESDNLSLVRYDFDDQFTYEFPFVSYEFYCNVYQNLLVVSSSTTSIFIYTSDEDYLIFEVISGDVYRLYNDDNGLDIANGYLSNGFIYFCFFADYLYSCISTDYPNSQSFGICCDDFGYCYYTLDVVIPQSDNIFKSYFANLNYSLDNWFTFGERDIVYNAFNSIFGSQSNIMPIFVEGSFIPKYLTYMSWIYVLHLAFDFLVFIPRLAHKWMGGVYKDEDS